MNVTLIGIPTRLNTTNGVKYELTIHLEPDALVTLMDTQELLRKNSANQPSLTEAVHFCIEGFRKHAL